MVHVRGFLKPSYLRSVRCWLEYVEVFLGTDGKASKFVVKRLLIVIDGKLLVDFGY